MKHFKGLAMAGSLLLVATVSAAAQPADPDYTTCTTAQGPPPKRIGACTAVIAREAKETKAVLRSAFFNRGNGFYAKGDYESATEDYDRAISLDPTYSPAFFNRGLSWEARGQRDLAITDYMRALWLTTDANARRRLQYLEAGAIPVPEDKVYGHETADFGVPAQDQLYSEMGNTPTGIPSVTVLTTHQLAGMLNGDDRFLLLDAFSRAGPRLPGALRAGFAGDGGTFSDATQKYFEDFLAIYTRGDRNVPLVIYCVSGACRHSYNAVLRAKALGYNHIYWYRGGTFSWTEARLPMTAN